ncbi:carbonate dehydratase [Bacillus thuringiensis]|uniref:carbonate dehydratase n=1 Tax=Bacillus thuringiensis TaxID=1428 RepID=UPI00333BDFFE
MRQKSNDSSSQKKTCKCIYDSFPPFIGPNPITSFNPTKRFPLIDKTAFISPFSSIIGDVRIANNVFVAPNVSIRADEGTPFSIGSNTNIQDGVVLHGLLNQFVSVKDKEYSIYIGNEVSIAHGALIHGPCFIGNNVFVSFKSIVYNALVEDGAFISYNTTVTNGVRIPSNRFVPPYSNIDTQEKADALPLTSEEQQEFAHDVQFVNQQFPSGYRKICDKYQCSCGVLYDNC